MPEPFVYEGGLMKEFLAHFFLGGNKKVIEETEKALELMKDANTLGSIMKFDISDETRAAIQKSTEQWENQEFVNDSIKAVIPSMKVILALTDKYATTAMNPPYMGSGKFDVLLSEYTKINYTKGKSDLATVFIEMVPSLLSNCGKYTFIVPPSWMFLSSFEDLRRSILENHSIDSLLHLSRGIFGADFGSSAAIISKSFPSTNTKGTYFRLIERTFQEFEQNHLRILFEKTLANHDFRYKFSDYEKSASDLPYSEDGNIILYSGVLQKRFTKIAGAPIGYWVSKTVWKLFDLDKISTIGISDGQNITGDNNKYLRYYWEISSYYFGKDKKWVPIAKGGNFRKWYGNIIDVINWSKEARQDYKNNPAARIQEEYLWYMPGITWNLIFSNGTSFRLLPDNCLFNKAAPTIVIKNDCLGVLNYALGFLNTPVVMELLKIMNPTFNTNIAEVFELPFIIEHKDYISTIVSQNISISTYDWDAHEPSWDFKENELIRILKSDLIPHLSINGGRQPDSEELSFVLDQYKLVWAEKFNRLHANEEELNRQFIDIYGLQDELTPDVPLDEITNLQQVKISIEKNQIVRQDDILIKQLLSYAAG